MRHRPPTELEFRSRRRKLTGRRSALASADPAEDPAPNVMHVGCAGRRDGCRRPFGLLRSPRRGSSILWRPRFPLSSRDLDTIVPECVGRQSQQRRRRDRGVEDHIRVAITDRFPRPLTTATVRKSPGRNDSSRPTLIGDGNSQRIRPSRRSDSPNSPSSHRRAANSRGSR